MSSYKHYYLVDTENVGYNPILGLPEDSLVIYFTRDRMIEDLGCNERVIVTHDIKGTNALDFIIDSYLGYLIAQHGMDAKYYIFSKDGGFDCVKYFWGERDYDVTTIKESILDWNTRFSEQEGKNRSIILSVSDTYEFYIHWYKSLRDRQRIHLRKVYRDWSTSNGRDYEAFRHILQHQFNCSKEASVSLTDFIYNYGIVEVM